MKIRIKKKITIKTKAHMNPIALNLIHNLAPNPLQ